MPRIGRILFSNGLFHIYSRGIEKREIFKENKDYHKFLAKLEDLTQTNKFKVYCYVLLPNHFHLLLETNNTSISKIMSRLLTSYAVYFNIKNKRVGPLFQDRFKSILVQKDNYLYQLTRYIHLNPVKAGLVKNPSDYAYSSIKEIIKDDSFKYQIIKPEIIAEYYGKNSDEINSYLQSLFEYTEELKSIDDKIFVNMKLDVLGTDRYHTEVIKRKIKKF